MSGAIRKAVRSRGITRLCHFTKVGSLTSIYQDGAIWSTQALMNRDTTSAGNDASRYDGHLDYVSCSVQFPNLHVLDAYKRNESPEQDWVVLLLSPLLLSMPTTKFAPVNAATASGLHVSEGLDGFGSLYQNQPPSLHNIYRADRHLKSCPTDNQAEVLIHRSIPLDLVIGIVLENERNRGFVAQVLAHWPDPAPPLSGKQVFFNASYVSRQIWTGCDIEFPMSRS